MNTKLTTSILVCFIALFTFSNTGCHKEPIDLSEEETENNNTDTAVTEGNNPTGTTETIHTDTTTENTNSGELLPFIPSALPPYARLESHYLQYGSHLPGGGVTDAQFAVIVGGLFQYNVENGFFENTCASRVSHALNLSGHRIPAMSGKTSSGGNGFKYIFRVLDLNHYMIQKYGQPHITSTNMNAFIGRKGIIIFDTRGLWSDASGHASIWNKNKILGGNYAQNPSYYFENSVNIMFWAAN